MKSYVQRDYNIHKAEVKRLMMKYPYFDCIEMNRNEIIESSINQVWEIAMSFSLDEKASGIMNVQDLIQEGYIGLIEGVDKLDYDILLKAENPEAMAILFIKKRIWGQIRRSLNQKRGQMKLSEYAVSKANKGDDKRFVDSFFNAVFDRLEDKSNSSKFYLSLGDKELEYDINFIHQYLVGLINKYLDIDEATAIKMSYGIGCDRSDFKDISNKIKVPSKSIKKILKKGISKLKEVVEPSYVAAFMNE